MKGKILVAGIGNIFLGDDAFGVEVVNRLRARSLPDYVSLVDFGIRSYDLAYALMEDWDLVILIDALPRGGVPGTLYTIEPELPEPDEREVVVDAHTMNPVSALQLVEALGGRIGRLLLVGCEPETVEPDREGNIVLSGPVSAAVNEALRAVEELIMPARVVAPAA
jgi:hydrogenase maturation protease